MISWSHNLCCRCKLVQSRSETNTRAPSGSTSMRSVTLRPNPVASPACSCCSAGVHPRTGSAGAGARPHARRRPWQDGHDDDAHGGHGHRGGWQRDGCDNGAHLGCMLSFSYWAKTIKNVVDTPFNVAGFIVSGCTMLWCKIFTNSRSKQHNVMIATVNVENNKSYQLCCKTFSCAQQ